MSQICTDLYYDKWGEVWRKENDLFFHRLYGICINYHPNNIRYGDKTFRKVIKEKIKREKKKIKYSNYIIILRQ